MLIPSNPSQVLVGVQAETITTIIAVFLMLIGVVFKVYPDLKKVFTAIHERKKHDEEIVKSLNDVSSVINTIAAQQQEARAEQVELGKRVAKIYKITKQQQQYLNDGLEEREILMTATRNLAQSLQELGANGITKQTVAKIDEYLTKKAHSAHTVHGGAETLFEE